MRYLKIRRGIDYDRRLKLLKSNRPRIVVRFTNRSCIIQKISPGFNLKGDHIIYTALYHKKFPHMPCNVVNVEKFYRLVFDTLDLKTTILDIGHKNKSGQKVQSLFKIYNSYL